MKNNFLIKTLILSLLYIIISPAYAQQDQTKLTQETEQQKQAKKKSTKKAAAKTFIPSEKISADSSVSFPVDI